METSARTNRTEMALCGEHLAEVQRILVRMGKFWSKLAKVINVWRTPGNARKLYQRWSSLVSKERADKVVTTLPPKPLKGRWGAAANAQCFLLRATRQETRKVFHAALVAPKSSPAARHERSARDVGGDPDEEEHNVNNGRWTREAWPDLDSDDFGVSSLSPTMCRAHGCTCNTGCRTPISLKEGAR